MTLERGLVNEEGDEFFEASAFVTPLPDDEEAEARVTEITAEEPRSAVIGGTRDLE